MSCAHEGLGSPSPDSTELSQQPLTGCTGYINAGGRGTRLSSIFHPHERRGVSKALLPIGNPPISLLEHHVNKLVSAGVPMIVAGVGDHENVAAYMESTYKAGNVQPIHYAEQLGNGGDLVRAVRDHPKLFADDILIVNVDTLLDINEAKFLAFHRENGGELSIALTKNRGVPNEDAYYVGAGGEILYSAEATTNNMSAEVALGSCSYRGSSTGALIASREAISMVDWQPEDGELSIYRDIVASAIGRKAMFGFNIGKGLFIDVGTVDTWHETQEKHAMIAPYIHYANNTCVNL